MKHLKQAALIGVSGYGAQHLQALRELHGKGRVRLAAAVVINPAEVPDELAFLHSIDCRIFPDSAAMYQTLHPDLVAIPTGIGSHEPLTLEALRHGCSVLVEKPAAATLEAVDRMLAAERLAAPGFVAVGFQHLYDSGVRVLKRRILAGEIGKLRQVVVTGIARRPDEYYRRNSWAGRLTDAAGGAINDSPVNNAFAHYLNLGLFFAGGGTEECAALRIEHAELYRAREIESFDSCCFDGPLENGARLYGFFSHTFTAETPRIEVRLDGSCGTLIWAVPNQWRWLDPAGGEWARGSSEGVPTAMLEAVLRRLDDPAAPVCTLQMARSHGDCIAQLHRNFPIRQVPATDRVWSDSYLFTPKLERRFMTRLEQRSSSLALV